MTDRIPTPVTVISIVAVAVAATAALLWPFAPPVRARTVAPATPASSPPTISVGPPASAVAKMDASETAQRRLFERPRPSAPSTRVSDPKPPAYLLRRGITRVAGAGRRVALTFDDGPSANTTAVLDILSRYDAQATFFMVGRRVRTAPHLARAVVEQGSEVGNHTLTHQALSDASVEQDEAEIAEADTLIYEATGTHPRYVRPKGGQVDDAGMRAIRRLHKVYAYWDVAGFDTVPTFTAARIRDSVLADVRPGSVIVLHETNARTVEALPQILAALKRRGYRVGDLTSLLR